MIMKAAYKKAIIIFAKYPAEGKVKTRLAKTLGNEFAAGFYKLCSEHTFAEVNRIATETNTGVYLFASAKDEIDKMKDWVSYNFILDYQRGTDLGERMYNAFAKVFDDGCKKTVIIGTDAPGIDSRLIKTAFEKLDYFDTVIGPSNDGGYYLLGLKENNPDLFEGIMWSTGEVFQKTVEKLDSGKKSFCLLDELTDIDTLEDLLQWLAELKDNHHPLKQTVKNELKRRDFLP